MPHQAFAGRRLSDRERRTAGRVLSREQRRGRIDARELQERLAAVTTARTQGDLAPVFADLGGAPLRSRGPARRGAFPFPLLPLLVIGIVVAATGHVPWVPIAVAVVLLLVLAPWRRRRWAGRRGWAC